MLTCLLALCFSGTYQNVHIPRQVVKILDSDGNEAAIYVHLHRLNPASPNYTIPCDVIHKDQPVHIMPWISSVSLVSYSNCWEVSHVVDGLVKFSRFVCVNGHPSYRSNHRNKQQCV
ncbi:hypothetical protein C8Q80DRAFT_766263 [Daedaleopsis nitida]|nr:hypothetical protein C8Q80DRAFT_766263 [Daedaleopsis nitida]